METLAAVGWADPLVVVLVLGMWATLTLKMRRTDAKIDDLSDRSRASDAKLHERVDTLIECNEREHRELSERIVHIEALVNGRK